MIATILRQAPADRRASITAWRQLSDILAQRGNQLDDDDIRRSLHALAVLRPRIPEAVRRDCARAIARHGRFAPLVALYANDVPAVSATMLRDARLAEADWLAVLPATNAMARSVLASRSDLPGGVYRALASLGAASVALPQPQIPAADEVTLPPKSTSEPATESHPSQISELVRRIDKYQSTRTQPAHSLTPRAAFLFETGPDGVIHWAEGVTRGAVIGLSIADAAFGGEPGTDGVAAGAFRQRAEIINARMLLEGTPADAGEWRFSALPWFDPATGQFRGYRASARRPHRNETPYGRPAAEDSGDSIRQLIHELRSPLNAISGFAQIISGQMFGPVSHNYRAMAEKIVADAASVQAIIDDLETAARSGSDNIDVSPEGVVDIDAIVKQVEGDLASLLVDQRVDLSISRVGGPFFGPASDANVRRMVGRLLTALVDVSEPGAILVGQLVLESPHDDMLQLRIVRPATIRFATAADLLDPGFSPEGEAPGAAVLSLGFSLRLVDSLARASGGRLDIGHNALTLHLPSANSKAEVELEAQQGE
ncbi:His Kinase A (phospho-acceptor) domain-containing protein [Sphingopyxis sp. YR583]|uniref:histidine kinase dimerization/phospho-acceptor domain-containing protein n=1 Tax=Sphingopyxis sp. YR583 TaxID=1881047 RepID=UPI0008A811D6|nr:histidine kinase dimerization/phospho-acceptor domain-containing protein [Sphingopyxis sp. YR583]SEH18377.1 His Kinase A (phospho-acceptor) domain-containing protein [Sphingopyxis sp. YR583]